MTEQQRMYIKAAIAVLSQNKTYPGDVELAKTYIKAALNA